MKNKGDFLENIKDVGSMISSVGITSVVLSAAKLIRPVNPGLAVGASFAVGTAVIMSMVADSACKHIEEKVDHAADIIEKFLSDKPEEIEVTVVEEK